MARKKAAVKPETKKAVAKVAVTAQAMKQMIAELETQRAELLEEKAGLMEQVAWYKRQLARKGGKR